MTRNQTIGLVLICVALVSIYFVLPVINYVQLVHQQEKDWYRKEYLNKSFNGLVYSISTSEVDSDQVVIVIDCGTQFHLSYHLSPVDKNFIADVKKGDSAHKVSGATFITFCNNAKLCKDINFRFPGQSK